MAKDLIAAIKEKQALISKLQAELDEARSLLAGGHIGKDTRHGRINRSARGKSARRPKRTPVLPYKRTSSVGRAARAIREAGEPLHIDDLVSRVNRRGRKVKKTTLVGNLARYVQKRLVFSRTAPNTFGLLEWQKGAVEAEAPKRTPVRREAAA